MNQPIISRLWRSGQRKETPVQMILKSSAECHARAAFHVNVAAVRLREALEAEGGLEWSARLRELIDEAEHVEGRLLAYAQDARSAAG